MEKNPRRSLAKMRQKPIVTLIIGLAAGTCLILKHGSSTPAPPAITPAKVTIQTVEKTDFSERITFPARVISKVSAAVLADSDGIVSHIPVSLGESVGTGRALMEISHTDPIYKFAKLIVRAPLRGVVSSLEVTEGAQVTKGQHLASITDPTQLKVVIEVPAEDRAALARGMKAEFEFGNAHAIALKMQALGPFIDPATGTSPCELEIDPASKSEVAAGMVGQVSIATDIRKAIQIPEYAVIYRNQVPGVRTLVQGKAEFIPVELGKKSGEKVEILSGLKTGDVLIERSSRFVADNETVEVETPAIETVQINGIKEIKSAKGKSNTGT